LERHRFAAGNVDVHRAWTAAEVRDVVRRILADHALPADKRAKILVKPNLNNDLVALTGNSTDLRVLCSLIEGLADLGYRDVTLADGANVGVERRNIDVFRRLRIEAMRQRYGIRIADLNREPGRRVPLEAGAAPRIANIVLDADFRIWVPTVKTHAEVGLSSACKNGVGLCFGQDKREMHYDIARNIAAIAHRVPPHLVISDGLVGMEGNGPGDGEPFRLGVIGASADPWLHDLVVARLVGLPWGKVPYLVHGLEGGRFTAATAREVEDAVSVIRPLKPAPPRSRLAIVSERRELLWLKKLVRPVVSQPRVAELAYKAKIIQDVYSTEDDTLRLAARDAQICGSCRRCEDFCPTHLPVEQIGVKTGPDDCVQCLYCWWVCPKGALTLEGQPNAMERQIERYKPAVEKL
jgi:uncharacterized protein (DUF362 family)/ferredoxin